MSENKDVWRVCSLSIPGFKDTVRIATNGKEAKLIGTDSLPISFKLVEPNDADEQVADIELDYAYFFGGVKPEDYEHKIEDLVDERTTMFRKTVRAALRKACGLKN